MSFLFKLLLRIRYYEINKAINELKYRDNNAEYLQRAWDIYNYHCQNNENYQNFVSVGDKSIKEWQLIPIIRKKDFTIPFYSKFARESKKYHFNRTSGSSGIPFNIVKDKYCHAITWAFINKLYVKNHIFYATSKQARFYGIPLSFKEKLKEKLKDFLLNRVRFSVYNLNDDKLFDVLWKFKKYKFDYAYGYTSVLVLFSRFLIKNKINLKENCPSIKSVICTSETCTDSDRKLIELAFGVNVLIEYGASELDVLAFTNEYGELEINDSTVYIEVVDIESEKLVVDGTLGKLIVTSLYNKALPFIRYEVGDLGSIGMSKYNGKRILTKLEGRLNDFILLPSGKLAAGFTLYYLLKDIIYNLDIDILEYRIIQKSTEIFVLEYVSLQCIDEHYENLISRKFYNYLEDDLIVKFKKVEFIKREKSGKFKHFISEIGGKIG